MKKSLDIPHNKKIETNDTYSKELYTNNMELLDLSKTALLEMCKELKIQKCKNKSKEDLIDLIKDKKLEISNKEFIIVDENDLELDSDNNIKKSGDECNITSNIKGETTDDTNLKNTVQPKLTKEEAKLNKEKLLIEIESLDTEPLINDKVTLYYGDCIVEMSKIPDDSVDLILCDLPYGTTKCKWDTIIDLNDLWKHYKRVIKKPSGVILLFGQQPFTSMLVSSNYEWFKYNLIWKKNKTTQFLLANYRPMKCTEDICVFSKGGAAAASRNTGNMTYNPQGLIPTNIKKKNSKERIGKMLNQEHHLGKNNKLISDSEYTQNFTNYPNELIEFDIEYDTIHETQKPVKLIEYLIKTYSNDGGVVLDNTMGSGTTGVGCLNTNRKFIGIEKEAKYFKLSKHRIISKL